MSEKSTLQKAFMQAVARDDAEEAKRLIAAGADVNAAEGEYANTPLMKAAQLGHEQMAGLLIRSGATLDAADAHGETALHWAVLSRHPRLAALLIKKGARVHQPDEDHDTAFDLAVLKKDRETIDLIRSLPGPQAELEMIKTREAAAAAAAIAAAETAEREHLRILADKRGRLRAHASVLKPGRSGA